MVSGCELPVPKAPCNGPLTETILQAPNKLLVGQDGSLGQKLSVLKTAYGSGFETLPVLSVACLEWRLKADCVVFEAATSCRTHQVSASGC